MCFYFVYMVIDHKGGGKNENSDQICMLDDVIWKLKGDIFHIPWQIVRRMKCFRVGLSLGEPHQQKLTRQFRPSWVKLLIHFYPSLVSPDW